MHAPLSKCPGVLALVACALSACAPDLTASSEVVRPRILAARIEVQDEPARATPQPGETALLRLQVGFPQKPPKDDPVLDLGAAFCLSVSLASGRRFCLVELPQELIDYELVETGPDELSVRFRVPDLEDMDLGELAGLFEEYDVYFTRGDLPDLVMFGSLCVEGSAHRDPDADLNETPLTEVWSCRREAGQGKVDYPYVIAFTKTLFRLDLENRNPDIACDASVSGSDCDGDSGTEGDIVLELPPPKGAPGGAEADVVEWQQPPADLAEDFEDCDGDDDEAEPALPQVHVGDGTYRIRLRFDPSDRERLPDDPDRPADAPDIEELRVYAYHTEGGGTLDATLRLITADVPNDEMQVEFEFDPAREVEDVGLSVPKGGRVIRFYFAVLDGRGGADFTSRAICLLRPD